MLQGHLNRLDTIDVAVPLEEEDPPVVRWPKPTIKIFELGGRTVMQLELPGELLEQLDAAGDVEVQVLPERTEPTG